MPVLSQGHECALYHGAQAPRRGTRRIPAPGRGLTRQATARALGWRAALRRAWGAALEKDAPVRYNARMNASLKITRIGNSAGVVLPKELLARLRAGVGDTLYVSETPDGIRITAADPAFEAKMALAEQIMREDRDILRVLAK